MNPLPSERVTSFSRFLIFMCSAWKFLSIMKPLIKRILLQQYVGSYEVQFAYLFSYSLQSSRRLIPGWAHKLQNTAIDPSFCSSFPPYPKPKCFQEVSTLHCWQTLNSSQYLF